LSTKTALPFMIGWCTICKQEIMSNAHLIRHFIQPFLLQRYKMNV
jgi:hypothetical protein